MVDSPAGWHPDPYRTHELRYFDGSSWTEHVSDQGQASTAPAAYPSAPTTSPAAPTATLTPVPTPEPSPQPAPTPAPAAWGTTPPGPAQPPPVAPQAGYAQQPPSQPGYGFAASPATTAATSQGPAVMSYSMPIRIAVFVGAGLLIFGSFLPWVKASVAFITFEKNGMDGDGAFTLILGIAAVLVFSLVRGTAGRVLTLVAGLLAAAVTFYDIVDVQRLAGEVTSGAGSISVDASVGIGLWVCAIGALVVLVGAAVAFGEAMSKAKS
jgi:hypothetical protein